MNCSNCGKETTNPKFCSKSCSAISTNRASPKRSRKGKCRICDTTILSRRTYCDGCEAPKKDYSLVTLGRLKSKEFGKHPSFFRGKLNIITRKLNEERKQVCQKCGYNKHIEYCHIIPVKSFSENEKITVISSPSNIAILCPNCHWEFDQKLWSIQDFNLEPQV